MLKNVIINLFMVLLLSACSTNNPTWFNYQGFNLTECAPTATANVLRWSGIFVTNQTVRALNRYKRYWTIYDINAALNYFETPHQLVNPLTALSRLDNNTAMIAYIDHSHFIMILRKDGLAVADSLRGFYFIDRDELLTRLSKLPNGSYYKALIISK